MSILGVLHPCRCTDGGEIWHVPNFAPHRCNVSPLRGEKPQIRPLSKLNTGRFALCAMLPVTRNAVHARNTLTVPRMSERHTAQLRNTGEQVSQQTRCPQGRNTVLTWRSMQTVHVLASRSRRFSANSASQSATTHQWTIRRTTGQT